MTLEEAMGILRRERVRIHGLAMVRRVDAFKIALEAMNAIKQAREGSWASFKDLLPGETEE